MIDQFEQYQKCRNCKHYDPSPYPEYKGKLALCRGNSYQYKVGYYTLANDCFEPKEDINIEISIDKHTP